MQNAPVTVAERFSAIGGAAIFACVIFGVATLLHRSISNNDERKAIQGRPIRWWVTGLYLAGAIIGAVLADNQRSYLHEIVGGFGGFGIIGGLLVGNIHGWVNLLLSSDTDREIDDDTGPPSAEISDQPESSEGNPYSPPTSRLK